MRLIALAGLPGTGKSTLARLLAAHLECSWLDKDRVRAALFAPGEVEYSREQDDLVMEFLYRTVEFHARRGSEAVVLDGRTYSRRDQVRDLRRLAARLGARLALLECTCPSEIALARLEQDQAAARHPAANRGPELYLRLAAAAEPIEGPKAVLDSGHRSPQALLELALRALETL